MPDDKCPWCGAVGQITGHRMDDPSVQYFDWMCGSHKRGSEPWQSGQCEVRCEINRLTQQRDRAWRAIDASLTRYMEDEDPDMRQVLDDTVDPADRAEFDAVVEKGGG